MFRCSRVSTLFLLGTLEPRAMDLSALKPLLFLLFLSGFSAAQEILPVGPLEALVGKNVTFPTLVDKPEYSFIVWNYNHDGAQTHVATVGPQGLKVNTPYAGRATINATNGHLTLTGLTAKDSGEYSINIISPSGATQTGEIELRVIEPVSDVLIKSDLPVAIETNSTVVLTCTAKGSFLKFSWLNGTAAIVPDGKRVTLKETDTSSALTVTSVYRTDLAGPLFCSASNSLSSGKSAAFNLTVYYGPEEVSLLPLSPPQFIASKSNFSLSCLARSNPPASFTWYREDLQLEHGEAVLPLDIIEIHNPGSTAHQYTCKAENSKTKRTVASPTVSFAIVEPVSEVKVSGPKDTMLFAGTSNASLSCEAKGTVKTVAWLKDGKPLSASGRVVITADGKSVLISPLQKEDNGKFTCQVSNAASSESASVTLSVIYGPEPAEVEGDDKVEVNDPVKLDCSAASVPPANYTWKFNGTKTDVTTSEYIIDQALYSHTGTYTCEAHNALTGKTTTKDHFLAVKAEGELDEGLSDGAIAGIVIGVLAAVAIAVGLFFYCRQKVPLESPY